MKTEISPVTKTASFLLVLSSFVAIAALATWTFSAWDFLSAMQVSDQQVVEATMGM